MKWQYIINRAKERSTWLGIVAFATGAGFALSPEQAEAVASFGAAAGGIIAALWPDPEGLVVDWEDDEEDEDAHGV